MAHTGQRAGLSNPYERLGLAPGASMSDVKRAYRRLAMHFHPDRAGPDGVAAFLAVKAAYDWIVRQSIGRTPVRVATTYDAPPPSRSTWPGGRWYWDDIRARAAARTRQFGTG